MTPISWWMWTHQPNRIGEVVCVAMRITAFTAASLLNSGGDVFLGDEVGAGEWAARINGDGPGRWAFGGLG